MALGPGTKEVFVQMLSAERHPAVMANRDRRDRVSGAVTHITIHRMSPFGMMNRPLIGTIGNHRDAQMSRHGRPQKDPRVRHMSRCQTEIAVTDFGGS
jgi:hypothetical protein